MKLLFISLSMAVLSCVAGREVLLEEDVATDDNKKPKIMEFNLQKEERRSL